VEALLQAFVLGNGAILTNVCMLPLYPGLVAFLAAQRAEAGRAARGMLGLYVLAGVLVLMLVLGAVLAGARASFAAILPWLLPAVYAVVAALGVALLLGRSPFARLATLRAPLLRDPRAAAFVYGLLLAPMTLPCTGPVIVAAFVLGAGDPGALGAELAYVLAFGLGFGWPLAVLPWLAVGAQRRVLGGLARHHRRLEVASGALLVAIAAWGVATEVVPNLA
jgi:cytochrome c-type biogenesis protein